MAGKVRCQAGWYHALEDTEVTPERCPALEPSSKADGPTPVNGGRPSCASIDAWGVLHMCPYAVRLTRNTDNTVAWDLSALRDAGRRSGYTSRPVNVICLRQKANLPPGC